MCIVLYRGGLELQIQSHRSWWSNWISTRAMFLAFPLLLKWPGSNFNTCDKGEEAYFLLESQWVYVNQTPLTHFPSGNTWVNPWKVQWIDEFAVGTSTCRYFCKLPLAMQHAGSSSSMNTAPASPLVGRWRQVPHLLECWQNVRDILPTSSCI